MARPTSRACGCHNRGPAIHPKNRTGLVCRRVRSRYNSFATGPAARITARGKEQQAPMATIPGYADFQGKIVPYGEAKVGVMTHAFNYGTGCFGGIRGYWNEDEQQLFVVRTYD